MKGILAALLAIACGLAAAEAPSPLVELRYCGTPPRTAAGDILRRADVLAAFKKAHPCPSTGKTTGACSGWAMDHVVPLACGGCDAVWNLQWFPNDLKSGTGVHDKDRFERKVYAATPPVPGTEQACKLQVVP